MLPHKFHGDRYETDNDNSNRDARKQHKYTHFADYEVDL